MPWDYVNIGKGVFKEEDGVWLKSRKVSKVEITIDFHIKIYFDSEVVCSKYCIHQIKAHNSVVCVCMKEHCESVSHSSTDSVATTGLWVKSAG